jgi:hypothetical protein
MGEIHYRHLTSLKAQWSPFFVGILFGSIGVWIYFQTSLKKWLQSRQNSPT